MCPTNSHILVHNLCVHLVQCVGVALASGLCRYIGQGPMASPLTIAAHVLRALNYSRRRNFCLPGSHIYVGLFFINSQAFQRVVASPATCDLYGNSSARLPGRFDAALDYLSIFSFISQNVLSCNTRDSAAITPTVIIQCMLNSQSRRSHYLKSIS